MEVELKMISLHDLIKVLEVDQGVTQNLCQNAEVSCHRLQPDEGVLQSA